MKKILLIETSYFDYQLKIKKAFEQKGFSVDLIDDRPSTSIFVKGLIRLNPDYVRLRTEKYFKNVICEKFRSNIYSYVIVILGQSLTKEMFLYLKKENPRTVFILYLWDSVINFPQFKDLSKGFDRTFSFDFCDCKKYGFKFLPLFYCDECIDNNVTFEKQYYVSYVGTIKKGKLKFLKEIKKQFSAKNIPSLFYFYLQSPLIYYFYKLTNREFRHSKKNDFHYTKLSYLDNLNVIRKSKIVIDVPMANQEGLSMRTFEALSMKTKLITGNQSIRNYDFYKPQNIYIYSGRFDFNDIFFNSDFSNMTTSFYSQYSIKEWSSQLIKNM